MRMAIGAVLAGAALATISGCGPTPPAPTPVAAASVPVSVHHLAPHGKIRIGLTSLNGTGGLPLKLPTGGTLYDGETGQRLRGVPSTVPLKLVAEYETGQVLVMGKGIELRRPSISITGQLVQLGRRRYPAKVAVSLAGTGLQFVNELDIEQYLEGVLPGELPAGFGIEAQKALAVAARTYALVQSGKHGGFDLCDRTCCQMYLGYHRGSQRGLEAVRATKRECLWDGDNLVYAFYSADCGGLSTTVDEVPLKDKPAETLPYLQRVKDAPTRGADYCCASPYHQWVRRFKKEELERRLNARPETEVGKLQELKVTAYDPSGRVRTVLLKGEISATAVRPAPKPASLVSAGSIAPPLSPGPVEREVTGWELRRSLGALALKSTRMKVDQPQPGVYRFVGSGFGHGLGLCQIGANGMAKAGRSYREILAHYYPGTKLARLPL